MPAVDAEFAAMRPVVGLHDHQPDDAAWVTALTSGPWGAAGPTAPSGADRTEAVRTAEDLADLVYRDPAAATRWVLAAQQASAGARSGVCLPSATGPDLVLSDERTRARWLADASADAEARGLVWSRALTWWTQVAPSTNAIWGPTAFEPAVMQLLRAAPDLVADWSAWAALQQRHGDRTPVASRLLVECARYRPQTFLTLTPGAAMFRLYHLPAQLPLLWADAAHQPAWLPRLLDPDRPDAPPTRLEPAPDGATLRTSAWYQALVTHLAAQQQADPHWSRTTVGAAWLTMWMHLHAAWDLDAPAEPAPGELDRSLPTGDALDPWYRWAARYAPQQMPAEVIPRLPVRLVLLLRDQLSQRIAAGEPDRAALLRTRDEVDGALMSQSLAQWAGRGSDPMGRALVPRAERETHPNEPLRQWEGHLEPLLARAAATDAPLLWLGEWLGHGSWAQSLAVLSHLPLDSQWSVIETWLASDRPRFQAWGAALSDAQVRAIPKRVWRHWLTHPDKDARVAVTGLMGRLRQSEPVGASPTAASGRTI